MTKMLAALRQKMHDQKLNYLLVPSTDAHGSEYLAQVDQRRHFISGFTGSAGWALIPQQSDQKALLWTDGRYYLQASQQLNQQEWQLMRHGMPDCPSTLEWLNENCKSETAVGLCAELMGVSEWQDYQKKLNANIKMQPMHESLVDLVWQDKPKRVFNPLKLLPAEFSGQDAASKLQLLRQLIKKADKCKAYVVTALDENAWLLNVRGSDIDFNPFFFSYLMVTHDGAVLFSDAQLTTDVSKYLGQLNIQVKSYGQLSSHLKEFAGNCLGEGEYALAGDTAHVGVHLALDGKLKCQKSELQKQKAVKNAVEQQGFRDCHLVDGAALCMYFGWLQGQLQQGVALSEVDVADKAQYFRSKQDKYVSLSFDTISSVGANGAIIHYKPERPHCATLDSNQIYLCDSGGQYWNGTTDVTRTLFFGQSPSQKFKHAFTSVLRSHVMLSMSKFPPGTSGYKLDAIARQSMWQQGMDYRHGTGHGVGHCLGVHEGPQSISFRKSADDVPLVPGMTVTIEPGFYLDGEFGIRIENVCLVQQDKTLPYQFGIADSKDAYMGFETVTMVPYGRQLIDPSMLTPAELKWVNAYHQECLRKLTPILERQGAEGQVGLQWLRKETEPIVA